MGSPYTLLEHLMTMQGLSGAALAKKLNISERWMYIHTNPRDRFTASGEMKFDHLRHPAAKALEDYFQIPISELRKPFKGTVNRLHVREKS
jgi:hypothetical protein